MLCVLEYRYRSGNQGRKTERDCLRPLSGEVRHKNANPPSEGGYERVGEIFSGRSKRKRLSGKDWLQKRHWACDWKGNGGWLAKTEKDDGKAGHTQRRTCA